jgi:hypothetical protein
MISVPSGMKGECDAQSEEETASDGSPGAAAVF